MKVLQGIANKIRFSTEVSGSDKSVSTSQVAVFELDGQPVEMKLPDSIIISNGDTVVLAGEFRRGLFKACAYKNMTAGVSGKNHVVLLYILGAIFSVVGIGTVLVGIGVIFFPVGLYLIYTGRKHAKAYDLVTSS
jgi:hypothetical protein